MALSHDGRSLAAIVIERPGGEISKESKRIAVWDNFDRRSSRR
jgi:hypothetical protein